VGEADCYSQIVKVAKKNYLEVWGPLCRLYCSVIHSSPSISHITNFLSFLEQLLFVLGLNELSISSPSSIAPLSHPLSTNLQNPFPLDHNN